jgi:hypothetical protein
LLNDSGISSLSKFLSLKFLLFAKKLAAMGFVGFSIKTVTILPLLKETFPFVLIDKLHGCLIVY